MTETKTLQDGSIQITIPLPPITKKNQSDRSAGRTVLEVRKFPLYAHLHSIASMKKDCAVLLKPFGIDQPVNIAAKFYMPTKRRVDLTNLNEALHDILVKYGVLVDDNAKIIVSTDGSRVFCDKTSPRTEIIITAVEPTFE